PGGRYGSAGACSGPAGLRHHRGQRAPRPGQPRGPTHRRMLYRSAVSTQPRSLSYPGRLIMPNEHGPDMQYLRQELLERRALPCPTGFTGGIGRDVAAPPDTLGVPYDLTRRGTIRATLAGRQNSPDRAIASHLDTVGAMVSEVKDNGRLKLAPVGCWSSRFAEGSRVSVFSESGCWRGSVL